MGVFERMPYDRRVLLLALAAGFPAVALAMYWVLDLPARTAIPLTLIVVGTWLGMSVAIRREVVRPLETLSNLIAGVREGDFSVRARGSDADDALGLTLREFNALAETLREQRLDALEATALLRTVMDEIDVAIFAFDGERRLALVNGAGERLFGAPARRLVRREAAELGLGDCFDGQSPRTFELATETALGTWELRRSDFRQGGQPMKLIVLSDPSRILRQQEREAWRRLIRVVSHEINNSLAPIQSIADSVQRTMNKQPRPADWENDLEEGLRLIATRSEGLQRFMEGYARLARLPPPTLGTVDMRTWVERSIAMETRVPIQIATQGTLSIQADADQLSQLMINGLQNAADAVLESGATNAEAIQIGWDADDDHVRIWIRDSGPGISNPSNLFVPFFSTKPSGSGIGLALSRQIAEGHGGTLALRNLPNGSGAELLVELPRNPNIDVKRPTSVPV